MANGALFMVAILVPGMATLNVRTVAITSPEVQFTWRRRSSSTENTAAFGGDDIRAAACRHLNFVTAAGHFGGDGADSFIFRDFAFLELSDPNLMYACHLKDKNIFVAENVALCKEFFPACPKE
jgi:hypothetical protein